MRRVRAIRRGRLAARPLAVLVALAALAGCAGLPDSGGVNEGGASPGDAGGIFVLGATPGEFDDPLAIVSGFIQAAAAGLQSDFSQAREFLTPEARRSWDPNAGVVVFGTDDVNPVWNEETGTVTYSIPVRATVDSVGILTEADYRQNVTFDVEVDRGQWRISGLDDGIIMAAASFDVLYRPVSLVFAADDSDVAVPELRWFPKRNAATFATSALIAGPSPWLADAVRTGIPPSAGLSLSSVPITDGQASVSLTPGSGGSPEERSLALEQFVQTLVSIPEVLSVNVTVGSLPLGGTTTVDLAAAPVPGPNAVALVGNRLGLLTPDGVRVVAPEAGALPAGAVSPALAWDGTTAAFLIGSSRLVTADALASGTVVLDAATPEPDGALAVTTVLTGEHLVPPSFDRQGWLWTAEADGGGQVAAASPDGAVRHVPARWLAGRSVAGIRVASDGARVAILSRQGGLWRLDVAGIVRSEDGAPQSIGDPLSVGLDLGSASHLSWVDELTVAVLEDSEPGEAPSLRLATVGGSVETITSVPDAVELAVRYTSGSIMVVTPGGEIFQRSATGWSRVAAAPTIPVRALAFSG